MCPKCKTKVRCGNKCCRHKSEGPYYRIDHEVVDIWEHVLYICEACDFKMLADAWFELCHVNAILDGSWPDITPHMTERAKQEYDKIYEEYIR